MDIKHRTESISKLDQIHEKIKDNIAGCDFTICIFMAALNSYKVERNIRPFPQYFIDSNREKNFASLRSACDKLVPLPSFIRLPTEHISSDTVNFLVWLFFESKFPVLTELPLTRLPESILKEQCGTNQLMPCYVFEVKVDEKFEKTWENRIRNREVIYAFHGSAIQNFFSILKFGLQHNLTGDKEGLFGNGIYLSTDISVCTNYAPFGETWKHSLYGNKHSIIAVCQVINDEDEVKCKDKNNKNRGIISSKYGELPQKYLIVTNSDLVRLKYLLVYKRSNSRVVKSFFLKNCFWIIIFLYFLFLIFLGFQDSPYWQKFLRNIM